MWKNMQRKTMGVQSAFYLFLQHKFSVPHRSRFTLSLFLSLFEVRVQTIYLSLPPKKKKRRPKKDSKRKKERKKDRHGWGCDEDRVWAVNTRHCWNDYRYSISILFFYYSSLSTYILYI